MVHESAGRFEVEQDEGHRPVMGDRHLPVAVRGWMRLRPQLRCDRGEIEEMLRARESLGGYAAQAWLLLSHRCVSSCPVAVRRGRFLMAC